MQLILCKVLVHKAVHHRHHPVAVLRRHLARRALRVRLSHQLANRVPQLRLVHSRRLAVHKAVVHHHRHHPLRHHRPLCRLLALRVRLSRPLLRRHLRWLARKTLHRH